MMVNKIQVDIIIPFHMDTQFLRDAINSAQCAAGLCVRVIAINDSGKSFSKDELGLRDLDILHPSSSKGYLGALSTGVKLSNADFVTFLDSDDLLDSNKIRLQIELLRETKADLATGTILRFNKSIHDTFVSPFATEVINTFNQNEKLIFGAYGADSSILFRSSAVKNLWQIHSSFPPRLADYGWLLTNLSKIETVHCHEAIYYYRSHLNQMSRKGSLEAEWVEIHQLWLKNLNTFLFHNSMESIELTPNASQAIAFPTSLPELNSSEKQQVRRVLVLIAQKLHSLYPEKRQSIKILIGIRIALAYQGRHPLYIRYTFLVLVGLLKLYIQGYGKRRL